MAKCSFAGIIHELSKVVGQICAKFTKKCSRALKSAIFAGCLAFDLVIDISYSASCKINIFDRKIEFFYIFT